MVSRRQRECCSYKLVQLQAADSPSGSLYTTALGCFVHRFLTHTFPSLGMVNSLTLDERGDDMTFVTAVAKSMFSDGITNWGRIVSLMAFGAVLCQRLKEKGRDNCVELVGQEISTYLLSEQRDWLIKNNSWVSLIIDDWRL